MGHDFLFANCELGTTRTSFCVHAPDAATAKTLRCNVSFMALQALKLGLKDTLIFFPDCKRPYQIPAQMAATAAGGTHSPKTIEDQALTERNRQHDLLGADYLRILEFLMEQRQSGKIVIITSNTTNICYHTNDLLLPSRAHWSAKQFTGYNYLRSWRANREENPNNPARLNPQFDALRDLLARDGNVPGYEYTLYRPDDALCSYQTDYYLCRDYCGDEVRIGVSRPQDWSLLEPATV